MRKDTIIRPKYWWLWPDFYIEKDARDVSKMGVIACTILAALSGIFCIVNYFQGVATIGLLIGGVGNVFVYSLLGYGILKMSRIAVTVALIYYVIEKISYVIEGGKIGFAPLFVWYFIQSNRAVYWYRGKMVIPKIQTPNILDCPHCGTKYNTRDYAQDAAEWSCRQCKKILPRE